LVAPGDHRENRWTQTIPGGDCMSALKDYQRYATRCLEEARISDDARHKAFLVEMGHAWQRLADQEKNVKGVKVSPVSEPDRGD
jgi:hypothetical protein